MKDPEQKDVFDHTFNLADLRVQLLGGSLRWLATILASAGIGLFIYLRNQGEKAELDYLIHLQGEAAVWTIGIVCVIWAVLAVWNWLSWWKRRNDAAG